MVIKNNQYWNRKKYLLKVKDTKIFKERNAKNIKKWRNNPYKKIKITNKFLNKLNNLLYKKIEPYIMKKSFEEKLKKEDLMKIDYLNNIECLLCNKKHDNILKHRRTIQHKKNLKHFQILNIKYRALEKKNNSL